MIKRNHRCTQCSCLVNNSRIEMLRLLSTSWRNRLSSSLISLRTTRMKKWSVSFIWFRLGNQFSKLLSNSSTLLWNLACLSTRLNSLPSNMKQTELLVWRKIIFHLCRLWSLDLTMSRSFHTWFSHHKVINTPVNANANRSKCKKSSKNTETHCNLKSKLKGSKSNKMISMTEWTLNSSTKSKYSSLHTTYQQRV